MSCLRRLFKTLAFLIVIKVARCGVFEEFERRLLSGEGTASLMEDFLIGEDKPKEIEITCPGQEVPIVNIKDIEYDDSEDGEKRKCMVLRLKGTNFDMKLELNCEDPDELF